MSVRASARGCTRWQYISHLQSLPRLCLLNLADLAKALRELLFARFVHGEDAHRFDNSQLHVRCEDVGAQCIMDFLDPGIGSAKSGVELLKPQGIHKFGLPSTHSHLVPHVVEGLACALLRLLIADSPLRWERRGS